ncbi:MAG TPA: membrane protein insertion efficiency factor YidD [Rhodospirillales bacterium]|nr:membrane protein insertion efficiency factor YidD [Rhodospirillales bacterium]
MTMIRTLIGRPLSRVLMVLVRGYQLLISPVLPGSCRFYPTCSAYALDALNHHGPLKGSAMALRRIGRCHPWGGSEFDPVAGSALAEQAEQAEQAEHAGHPAACSHADHAYDDGIPLNER